MKKILIAIDDDFLRETYADVFKKENFEVIIAKDGREALDLIKKENPDLAMLDVLLSEIGGLKILEGLREEEATQKLPVVIFGKIEKEKDRKEAIELEANDFLAAATVSAAEAVRRVRVVLGEQKTYRIALQKNLYNAKELITDFGYNYDLKCKECGADLVLYLMRDLSKGEDYFKLSFVCPDCQ